MKFELVKQGNYRGRVEETVDALAAEYVTTLPGLDPDAPSYEEARATLLRDLGDLLP